MLVNYTELTFIYIHIEFTLCVLLYVLYFDFDEDFLRDRSSFVDLCERNLAKQLVIVAYYMYNFHIW